MLVLLPENVERHTIKTTNIVCETAIIAESPSAGIDARWHSRGLLRKPLHLSSRVLSVRCLRKVLTTKSISFQPSRLCVFVFVVHDFLFQECQATDNLWVCLICGSVLCGSRDEDHVRGHYMNTLHAYAIEIGERCCVVAWPTDRASYCCVMHTQLKIVGTPPPLFVF